jgi:hypothetical protein
MSDEEESARNGKIVKQNEELEEDDEYDDEYGDEEE